MGLPATNDLRESIENKKEIFRRGTRYIEGEPGRGFYNFLRECLDLRRVTWEVHGTLCARLENAYFWRVPEELVTSGVYQQLNLMPRYTFKSTIGLIGYVLWIFHLNDPDDDGRDGRWRVGFGNSGIRPKSFNNKAGYDQRILIAVETQPKAREYMDLIKYHLKNNHILHDLFGDMTPPMRSSGLWATDRINLICRRDWSGREPNLTAVSVETGLVGGHYGLMLGDDVVGEKNITNDEQIQKVIDFHRRLQPIADKPRAIIAYEGTRWHDADLYGYLMDDEKDHTDVYIESAERDEEEIAAGKRPYFFPSSEAGPEMTKEMLAGLREKMGPFFYNAQMNNRVIDSETAMFKSSYFTDTEFELKIGPETHTWLETCYVCTTVDPAISRDKDSCNAVVLTVAWDPEGHGWILDMFREKGVDPDRLLNEIFRQDSLWGPKSVGIETRGFQTIYLFNARQKSIDEQQWPPWVELQDSGVKKEIRIAGLEPLAKGKRIHWQKKHFAIIDEFCRYPRGKYKDAIDAMAYQIELAIRGRGLRPSYDDLPPEERRKVIADLEWKKKLAKLGITGYRGLGKDWYNI